MFRVQLLFVPERGVATGETGCSLSGGVMQKSEYIWPQISMLIEYYESISGALLTRHYVLYLSTAVFHSTL